MLYLLYFACAVAAIMQVSGISAYPNIPTLSASVMDQIKLLLLLWTRVSTACVPFTGDNAAYAVKLEKNVLTRSVFTCPLSKSWH